MNEKPALSQISALADAIQRDEYLTRTYHLDEAFDKLVRMDKKEYVQFKYYFRLNEHYELNQLMKKLGFITKYQRNGAGKKNYDKQTYSA